MASSLRSVGRRDFLTAGSLAALTGCGGRSDTPQPGHVDPGPTPRLGPIPTRALGSTGREVTLFGLGGQATLEQANRFGEAVDIIHRALEHGVTYFDTSKVYGPSEDYFGEGLAGRRDTIFLATKTHDRSRDGSLRLLDDSLRRLRTDHVDLWQIHNVTTMEEVARIFAPGGAIEAIERARADGRVRHVGVTGHYDPAVLVECIRRYSFDTLLLALNAADKHRSPFSTELLPLAVQKKMGIIAMKVMGRGQILRQASVTPEDAVRYVLSLPISCAIVGCDNPAQVDQNVATAAGFTPLDAAELARIEQRALPVASESTYFRRA